MNCVTLAQGGELEQRRRHIFAAQRFNLKAQCVAGLRLANGKNEMRHACASQLSCNRSSEPAAGPSDQDCHASLGLKLRTSREETAPSN